MSERDTIGFDSLSAALLFVKRIVPRTPQEGWKFIQQLTLIRQPGHAGVTLETPAALLEFPGRRSLLTACGGWAPSPATQQSLGQSIPLAELYHWTELEATGRTEQARYFLVLPRPEDRTPGKLVTALAGLEPWIVRSRRRIETESASGFFELQSVSGQPVLPPIGLPGSPFVLAALADDVFVPPGLIHPLLFAYRFLFPPFKQGELHVWLPLDGRRVEWHQLREVDEAPADLARLVLLDGLRHRIVPMISSAARPEVALELRRTRTRRRLERASRVLYRIRSRASEFGPLLLRFLDLAEAGVDDLTYFSHATGDGPNAVVEHYLLADAALGDEDMWPELARLDCLHVLQKLGLPVFLPAEMDFCPPVEGLLRGGDNDDDEFLLRLRERVGLPAGGSDDGILALILPESSGTHWEVLHLTDGRPLREVITLVNRQANRGPVRRALDIARLDLTNDRRAYEERWQKLGEAEAAETVAATEAQIQELGQAADSLAVELARYSERLNSARTVTQSAAELLSYGLPKSLGEFADQTAQLIAEIANPRRAWLANADARQTQLKQVQADASILQVNAAEQIARVRSDVDAGSQTLQEQHRRILAGEEALAGAGRELEASFQLVSSVGSETEATLLNQRENLNHRRTLLEQQEQKIAALDVELSALQAEVASREQHVAGERGRLERKRVDLAKRRQRAEAELLRLQLMEREELPAKLQQLLSLEAELNTLRQQGIESRLAEVAAALAAKEKELGQAQQIAVELNQKLERVRVLNADHLKLKQQIHALRLQLEKVPSEPNPETVTVQRKAVELAESALTSAQSARQLLDRAIADANAAFSGEDFKAAELALHMLASSVEEARRSAESARPTNQLAAIEAQFAELSVLVSALRGRPLSRIHRWMQQIRS